MKPKPRRVPIKVTLKERLLDKLAAVLAVAVTLVFLLILFGPGIAMETARFLRDLEFLAHSWFPGWLD